MSNLPPDRDGRNQSSIHTSIGYSQSSRVIPINLTTSQNTPATPHNATNYRLSLLIKKHSHDPLIIQPLMPKFPLKSTSRVTQLVHYSRPSLRSQQDADRNLTIQPNSTQAKLARGRKGAQAKHQEWDRKAQSRRGEIIGY